MHARKLLSRFLQTSLLLAVFLTACVVEPAPPATQVVVIIARSTSTPLPTATWVPTATPIPPTATLPPTFTPFPSETPLPTATIDPISCGDLDVAWTNTDWVTALTILDRLKTVGLTCGDTSLTAKYYAAHLNYGFTLEQARNLDQAIVQYQAALAIRSHGPEAVAALTRLHAEPKALDEPCTSPPLQPFSPSNQPFITAKGSQLFAGDQPFMTRGVNYYPRNAPWDRFLPDSNFTDIEQELHLIAASGFNTIRIFLWYDPLFDCTPESAMPDNAAIQKLDAIITLAAQLNLRLIVTLNDLPDLTFRPLYTDYSRYDAQTAFIINRYKSEPAILAWDLRNEGDIDYQMAHNPNRAAVLAWLKHISALVRSLDPQHLTTAGWLENTMETADLVDILSFHHWAGAESLKTQIDYLSHRTTKPILVEEVGYPSPNHAETNQAKLLGAAVKAAEQKGAAGWLVWTAFDFPNNSPKPNPQNDYGLWRNDLSPKPALSSLPLTPLP
jgi:hypothetical protein